MRSRLFPGPDRPDVVQAYQCVPCWHIHLRGRHYVEQCGVPLVQRYHQLPEPCWADVVQEHTDVWVHCIHLYAQHHHQRPYVPAMHHFLCGRLLSDRLVRQLLEHSVPAVLIALPDLLGVLHHMHQLCIPPDPPEQHMHFQLHVCDTVQVGQLVCKLPVTLLFVRQRHRLPLVCHRVAVRRVMSIDLPLQLLQRLHQQQVAVHRMHAIVLCGHLSVFSLLEQC